MTRKQRNITSREGNPISHFQSIVAGGKRRAAIPRAWHLDARVAEGQRSAGDRHREVIYRAEGRREGPFPKGRAFLSDPPGPASRLEKGSGWQKAAG